MKELLTLRMVTDGTETTGTFEADHPLFYEAVSSIVIPKGQKLKIWGVRVSGADASVSINTKMTSSSDAKVLFTHSQDVSVNSSMNLANIKPIVVPSILGTELVTFTWAQDTAAITYFEVDVEIGGGN